MKKAKNNFITDGEIHIGILSLALPSMAGLLLQNIFNLVDMYFVGKLGHHQLAAVSLGGVFVFFIYTFVIGVSVGTTALVSRRIGEGKVKEAQYIGMQAVFLGFFLYAIVSFIGNVSLLPILEFLGAKGNIMKYAYSFTRVLLTCSIVVFIPVTINAYLRGVGDAITPMRALLLGTILNIFLDPILIFGFWIIPPMGVVGSAIATVIARLIGAMYLIYCVTRKKHAFQVRLSSVKLDLSTMWQILRIGFFSSLQGLMRNFTKLALMKFITNFTPSVLAAYGIGVRLRMTVMLPIIGLGVASATMVGQNLGAKQSKRAEESAWMSVAFGGIITIIASFIFYKYAPQIVSIFNKDERVISDGVLIFKYFAPAFFFMNMGVVLERSLNGAGDTISPLIIVFSITILLRILSAWYLMQYYGAEGIWMAISGTQILQGIAFALWFLMGKWKTKKV